MGAHRTRGGPPAPAVHHAPAGARASGRAHHRQAAHASGRGHQVEVSNLWIFSRIRGTPYPSGREYPVKFEKFYNFLKKLIIFQKKISLKNFNRGPFCVFFLVASEGGVGDNFPSLHDEFGYLESVKIPTQIGSKSVFFLFRIILD